MQNLQDIMTMPHIQADAKWRDIPSVGMALFIRGTLLGLLGMLTACGTSSRMSDGGTHALEKIWDEMGIADEYHTGLAVFDPTADKWLFAERADNAFTPASNIKILTLKTALDILPDTLASGWYRRDGDSLVIWGSGDPGTWYPDYRQANPMLDFIRSRPERIFISNGHFRSRRYGDGWAWDDYAYAFQAERTAMPIHGNRLWIERTGDDYRIAPALMAPFVDVKPGSKRAVGRTEAGDRFWYTYDPGMAADTVSIPLAFWGNDMVRLWSHYAGKTLFPSDARLPAEAIPVPGSARDSLLKIMMRESDNFMAEQLLLASSVYATRVMDEGMMIDSMLRKPLAPIARDVTWVDGSGLSRYNQVTPRALVWVLTRILEEQGMPFIRGIFPAGGVSGTLADWYPGQDGRPYVFAKTGGLAHCHSLSGYIVTKRGRVIVFSWMHNQFAGPATPVRKAMEKMLAAIYEAY